MAVKILAADDSETMRKVLEMTFAGESVEIETVGGGKAAVERASQNPPDLVIADASMDVDGYEVARALKGNPATANVAVLVLASQHTPYDAAKGKEAGVDDHILKPYDSQAMIDKAKEVLSKPRAKASGAPAAAAKPAAPPRPPSPPKPPAPRSPGAGRPAGKQPSPRSTVAFGAVQPPKPNGGERPVLELAEDDPKPAAAAKPAVPSVGKPAARPGAPAIGKPAAPKPATPAKPAAKPAAPARPAAKPAAPAAAKPAAKPAASAPAQAAASATASNGEMAAKLADLGLSQEQVEGVLSLSRDVIERVVWEVVPDLAEVIIREEIRRLTSE